MSISSDDSLGDLPLPYDISTAVSRALRINSTGGTASPHERDGCPKATRPSTSLTADDTSVSNIKKNITKTIYNRASHPITASCIYETSLTPNFTSTSTALQHYHSNPPIYDHFAMEPMDAWSENTVTVSICSSSESMLDSQNDLEQLDQFCNYIVSNSDDELPMDNTTPSAAPIYPARTYPGPSYYYQYPISVESPPRKKPRSTSHYADYHYHSCSSPENSPEKCITDNAYWSMKLENASLWRQFDEIGTEMVITKGGR